MRGEAASLAQASFGPTMLETIGRMYTMQADILLGGFFEGGIKAWQQRGHTMKTALRATGLAIKVFNAQQRIEKFERSAFITLTITSWQVGFYHMMRSVIDQISAFVTVNHLIIFCNRNL